MESEAHRRKIEEAVVEILRTADLETLTEYDIRVMLAERLNIDFTDVEEKLLVRQFVESYLLSLPEQDKVVEQTKEVVQEQSPQLICNTSPETRQISCTNICKLSSKRSVSVKNFGGKTLVSFNDFYQKDGKQFNTARGASGVGFVVVWQLVFARLSMYTRGYVTRVPGPLAEE